MQIRSQITGVIYCVLTMILLNGFMDDFVTMIDEMINWSGVFLSKVIIFIIRLFSESVMIGSGVLIQMRFTLSMVNRFYGVLKSNVFRIRKIDSDVGSFCSRGRVICKQVLNTLFGSVIEFCG